MRASKEAKNGRKRRNSDFKIIDEFTIKEPQVLSPQPQVGAYHFGETDTYTALVISLPYKPNAIKRFFMKHLLGFKWKDQKWEKEAY